MPTVPGSSGGGSGVGSADLVDLGASHYWITDAPYSATGDGATDDRGAFNSALNVDAVTLIEVPAGTYKISSDLTIPAGAVVHMHPGASFSIDNTMTITVDGELQAGNYQIWSGAGTMSFPAGTRTKVRYVRWDGTASDKVIVYCPFEVSGSDLTLPTSDITIQGKKVTFASAAPGAGTYAQGDIVLNSEPSTGEAIGWRCTTAPLTFETLTSGTALVTFTSGDLDLYTATGRITCNIAHGLGTPPLLTNLIACTLYVHSGYNSGDIPSCRDAEVVSIDGTNIVVMVYLQDQGATNTLGRVRCTFLAP